MSYAETKHHHGSEKLGIVQDRPACIVQPSIVQYLVEADDEVINAVDMAGETPLHCAASNLSDHASALVDALVEAGASAAMTDKPSIVNACTLLS